MARNIASCFNRRVWSVDFRLPRPNDTIFLTAGRFLDSKRCIIDRERVDERYCSLVLLYRMCSCRSSRDEEALVFWVRIVFVGRSTSTA